MYMYRHQFRGSTIVSFRDIGKSLPLGNFCVKCRIFYYRNKK